MAPAAERNAPIDFTAHYAELAPALYAWAVLRCCGPLGKALTADDLVQEVCLEGVRALPRFDPSRGEFRPWLFGVAHLVAANALRQLARGRLLPGDAMSISRQQALPAAWTTVSRRARRDEALEGVLDSVRALPEEDRQMFQYRGLERMEHAEVGELLGIGAEAASKRWQRLRERLQGLPAAAALLGES